MFIGINQVFFPLLKHDFFYFRREIITKSQLTRVILQLKVMLYLDFFCLKVFLIGDFTVFLVFNFLIKKNRTILSEGNI